MLQTVTPLELQEWINTQEGILIVDIREQYERDFCKINSISIPMGDIESKVDQLKKYNKVILFCKTGGRGESTCDFLSVKYKLTNIYNLEGGITAWANDIDNSLACA